MVSKAKHVKQPAFTVKSERCKVAYPLRGLNPCFCRERAMSSPLDEEDWVTLYGGVEDNMFS